MNIDDKYLEDYIEKALDLAEELKAHPELGYNEYESSAILRKYWEGLGLKVEGPFGKTGIMARIKGKLPGPTVCLLSELDAVISPKNPMANAQGVAHACGHNIQSAQVYLAGAALLKNKDILCGDVVLLAVPAEEFLEIEKRLELKKNGSIKYLSGKPELYRLGIFNEIDMVIMIHAYPSTEDKLYVGGGSLGFVAKSIRIKGVSGHGAAPFESKNALQAAMLFFAGVNANRETFRDEESIRIHPIITKGGEIVNSVPDDVRIETYVRGRTTDAIKKGCTVVDRCVKAASEMMGCTYEIETIPGYLPLCQSDGISKLAASIWESEGRNEDVVWGQDMVGSTDIGDLCHLRPSVQLMLGGFEGQQHGADFRCINLKQTILEGGNLLFKLAVSLLEKNAEKGREVISSFRRKLTDEEYFKYMDGGH